MKTIFNYLAIYIDMNSTAVLAVANDTQTYDLATLVGIGVNVLMTTGVIVRKILKCYRSSSCVYMVDETNASGDSRHMEMSVNKPRCELTQLSH